MSQSNVVLLGEENSLLRDEPATAPESICVFACLPGDFQLLGPLLSVLCPPDPCLFLSDFA